MRKLQYYRDGGSDKHLRDVRAMVRQLGPEFDRAVLAEQAALLGLQTEVALVTAPADG